IFKIFVFKNSSKSICSNTFRGFRSGTNYIQKHKKLTNINDLPKHKVIATPWQKSPLNVYKTNEFTEKQKIKLTYFAHTNTLPSALELVLHDMGMALLPEFVIQSALAKGELTQVLTNYQGRQWPFYMVHRFHGEKPIHITRFYQLVKHYFSKINN
ncbi:MAG: hypothetical protein HRT38_18460, partial [Alteromonadaceae bacterium]|nr:hypothetical protein [Alteromonadaceae bacterium]